MKSFLIDLIFTTIAILATAYILPGVKVKGFVAATITAFILGIINTFIRPILVGVLGFLTLPLTIITLGLFLFILLWVINSVLLYAVSELMGDEFRVENFPTAMIASIFISLVTTFLHWIF